MARPQGSMNKNKRGLLAQLKRQYGDDFNPIMKMAEHAVTLHEVAVQSKTRDDIKASLDAWGKVAEYTEPKLKALEVDLTSSDGTMSPTVIELIPRLSPDDSSFH